MDKQKRKDIVTGATQHIKSILVALKKFKNGSNVESGYADEHYTKLGWYLKQL